MEERDSAENRPPVKPQEEQHEEADSTEVAPPELITRRAFLNRLGIGLAAATAGLVSVPVLGFLFAPLLRKPPESWRPVGSIDSFKVGETVEVKFEDPSPLPWAGITSMTAAWLRREDEQTFTAYAVNCSHLGCPVNWVQSAGLFMCPCHGGVYYKDGTVAAGPPPKPLSTYNVRVRNGQVEIETKGVPIAGG